MVVEPFVSDKWLNEGDEFDGVVLIWFWQVDFLQNEYLFTTILGFQSPPIDGGNLMACLE